MKPFRDFLIEVEKMRDVQKEYLKTYNPDFKRLAKTQEVIVDKMLAEYHSEAEKKKQLDLF